MKNNIKSVTYNKLLKCYIAINNDIEYNAVLLNENTLDCIGNLKENEIY